MKSQHANFSDRTQRQTGAALLLLLAIAGVSAATFLISVFNRTNTDLYRDNQTRFILAQAKDALVGFALMHGRLPRPAISNTDGRESTETCTDERSCTGFLPWVTLGVSDIDGWAKHLVYSVTPAFTQPDFESLVAVPDKIVLGRAKEGLLYYLAGQENCTIATSCSPAIIFSYGKRNLGVGANNVAQPNGATNNIDEINNHTTTNRFIQRPATLDTETQGGEIDDQVTWITIKSLYTSMKAAGSLH